MTEPVQHSPEPWNADGAPYLIYPANGEAVAKVTMPENRARIVACVNALAGIPNEALAKLASWFQATYEGALDLHPAPSPVTEADCAYLIRLAYKRECKVTFTEIATADAFFPTEPVTLE
jgi:hypothetical protein